MMPMISRCLFLVLILFVPGSGFAQESLSLSAALEATLKNNYNILISGNDLQIAGNNNSIGNAGMLPSLDVSAGVTQAVVNTEQEYSNGTRVNRDGAVTDGLNAGAHFTWTLFDGMRMFAAKNRLSAMEDASGLQLKIQIENSVEEVIRNYFLAVNIQQQIRVLDDAIRLYDERVSIAEMKFNVGSGSKLDWLQSQVDRNARKSQRLLLLTEYDNAVTSLNRLMGRSEVTGYNLTDSVVIGQLPTGDELKKSVKANNYTVQAVMKQEEIYSGMLKEARSFRYPRLNLNVDYTYSRTENEVGFMLLNRSQGLYGGLTLSWNLFNGFNTGREIRNAKLNLNTASLILADTRARIDQALFVATRKFESDMAVLDLETLNAKVATENVNIAMEAFKLGSISGLELKDAQNSYEEALSRLANARYQAKLSETTLLKLNGSLVK